MRVKTFFRSYFLRKLVSYYVISQSYITLYYIVIALIFETCSTDLTRFKFNLI